jgi:pimeloyl-ACP methyl ester carboxylesterase
MAREIINGIGIAYELMGKESDPAIVLTPGGRFPMTTPGLHELGEKLVAGGRRVLLWDRPNCGQSDYCIRGDAESEMHGEALAGLIRKLDLGPMVISGGSAGSRITLITASRNPDLFTHVVVWWITGGHIGLAGLMRVYAAEAATMVSMNGMEAATKNFGWAEQCENNPGLRAALVATNPQYFISQMQKWTSAYIPPAGSPMPGMKVEDFSAIKVPVLIMQNGANDLAHTPATTEWVHRLIPHSKLVSPPWGDSEWNERSAARNSGDAPGLFVNWPKLAPQILDFIKS